MEKSNRINVTRLVSYLLHSKWILEWITMHYYNYKKINGMYLIQYIYVKTTEQHWLV